MIRECKVSVVIPLYNKERHIQRTLSSVLAQTIQDFEIVVVDDGSTDNSAVLVRAFKDLRIKYFRQSNAGVSSARNKGVVSSEACLVAFLDADDEWRPNFLETIFRLVNKFPKAGLFATGCEISTGQRMIYKRQYLGVPPSPWEGVVNNYFEACLGIPLVHASATAIWKDVLIDVGLFPEGEKRSEDLDLWARIALKYPIAFSNTVGAVYHQDADNRACGLSNAVAERVVVRTLKDALSSGKVASTMYPAVQEYCYFKIMDSAIEFIRTGNGQKGRKMLLECKTKRLRKRKWCWLFLSFLPVSLVDKVFRLRDRIWYA